MPDDESWVYYDCADGVYCWDEENPGSSASGPHNNLADAIKATHGFTGLIPIRHDYGDVGDGIEVTELEMIFLDGE